MKVVVTGATGNIGSALILRLAEQQQVEQVVGISRRPHDWRPPKVSWAHLDLAADEARTELAQVCADADAVVHLAWLFQPTRRPPVTWRSNVLGTQAVLDAVTDAGVGSLVVSSSVGCYSPRRHLDPVDESWPTHGVAQTAYSREKAYVERLLDAHERAHPDRRVVRMRPGFVFAERAATEQRRLFMGPLVPHAVVRRGLVPALPLPRDLRLQTVHADDVAEAFARAVVRPVRGAFNLAADPVLTPRDLADVFDARWLPTPARLLRGAMAAAYGMRAVPASPQLFDLLMSVPVMSTGRARSELGWSPQRSSASALRSFLRGLHTEVDVSTPPLAEQTSGPLRAQELRTGAGSKP